MADIFISYAHDDRTKIEQLAAALEADGYSVWWDRRIVGGAEFSKDIERELESAKSIIVAWSEASIDSRWVKDEATIAAGAGKLIAISLDGVKAPIGFKQFHTISYSKAESETLSEVKRAVAAKVSTPNRGQTESAADVNAKTSKFGDPKILAGMSAALIFIALLGFTLLRTPSSITERPEDEIADAENALGAPPANTQKTVAVLPFAALSAGENDQYFADGLTEQIIDALFRVPALQVTARTSSFYFKDKDLPVPEIANTLGVDHVVEGSVRRAGDNARITVQLIRAEDGFHLWSETYDHVLDESLIFDIQTDVAQKIGEALNILLDDKTRQSLRALNAPSVDAYIEFKKAAEKNSISPTDVRASLRALESVSERYPDFAAAHLARAQAWVYVRVSPQEYSDDEVSRAQSELIAAYDNVLRASRDPVQRAIVAADRELANGDWKSFGRLIEPVLDADVCDFGEAMYYFDIFGHKFSKFKNAADHWIECDPVNWLPWYHTVRGMLRTGEAELALSYIDRWRTVNPDQESRRREFEVMAHLILGDIDRARDIAEQSTNSDQRRQLEAVVMIATGQDGAFEQYKNVLSEFPGFGEATRNWFLLVAAARAGEREAANALASLIDTPETSSGEILLAVAQSCYCGAPFDLSASPYFAERIKDSGIVWPPAKPIDWPLKDW